MNHEMEFRAKLAKLYVLISSDLATPDRVEAAAQKLSEAVGILNGTIPVPQGEESHG